MGIKEIVGQDKLLHKLFHSLETGKLGHAYIFNGEEGIGKKTISTEFAAMILCRGPKDGRPCGQCSSCIKIKSNSHPDLYVESPEKREYTVEQLSDIQKEMRIKPNESDRKVFIFTEGDKLTVNFQNKFLKILEEPPETVVIIILVNNIKTLLETTVSRCQVIKVNPVSQGQSLEHINQRYGDLENLKFILAFADGNIGRAIKIIEDESFLRMRSETVEVIKDIVSKDTLKIMSNSVFFEENRDQVMEILDIMILWFRDILIQTKTDGIEYVINSDHYETIKEQAGLLDCEKIYGIIDILESNKSMLKNNVNYSTAIVNMLIDIKNKQN